MSHIISAFRLCLLASAATLVGCGGGEGEGGTTTTPTEPPQPIMPMLVMDGFSTVTPNTNTFIDLTPFVRGNNVSIASVLTDDSNELCGTPVINGSGVDVDIADGTLCEFAYTATQPGVPATRAALNVLATKAAEPILPPISQALVLGSGNALFNLPVLLGSDWKSTYSLNGASVQVQGIEGNLGSEAASGNTITYTPPELSGWNRIIFTLTDSAAPSEPVMGVIYITISEVVNQPPSIGKPKYDYNAHNASRPITTHTKTTLDLSTLPGLAITEPEAQAWQIVNVQSYTATVAPTAPDSVHNQSFDFTAALPGNHYVSYIVADHHGGYATGLIYINVSATGGPATWADIDVSGVVFSAPQTYTQASTAGFAVNAFWDEPVSNTVAAYNTSTAQLYCKTVGHLPTVDELKLLATGPADELAKWPKARNYWAAGPAGDLRAFDLSTGIAHNSPGSGPFYATCVQERQLELDMLASRVTADGQRHGIAVVTTPALGGQFNLSHADGTLDGGDVALTKGTPAGTATTVFAASIKAGTYRFRAQDAADEAVSLISGRVTFVADPSTGGFHPTTGLVITRNNAPADGRQPNRLTARLTDEHGNPIAGQHIRVTIAEDAADGSAELSTDPSSGTTDSNGELKINVTNRRNDGVVVTVAFEGRADGVPSTAQARVIFGTETYPCTVANDGLSFGYDCIPTMPSTVHPGRWFAPAAYDTVVQSTPGLAAAMANVPGAQRVDTPHTTSPGLWMVAANDAFEPSGPFLPFLAREDMAARWDAYCATYNIANVHGRQNWRGAHWMDVDTFNPVKWTGLHTQTDWWYGGVWHDSRTAWYAACARTNCSTRFESSFMYKKENTAGAPWRKCGGATDCDYDPEIPSWFHSYPVGSVVLVKPDDGGPMQTEYYSDYYVGMFGVPPAAQVDSIVAAADSTLHDGFRDYILEYYGGVAGPYAARFDRMWSAWWTNYEDIGMYEEHYGVHRINAGLDYHALHPNASVVWFTNPVCVSDDPLTEARWQ